MITSRRIESRSPSETERIGMQIGHYLGGGEVVALIGPLGSGKTRLVKGIARGLGLEDARSVTSPTFVLAQHYECERAAMVHVDAYRLADPADLLALGWDDWDDGDTVVVVEWADRVEPVLRSRRLLSVTLTPIDKEIRSLELDAAPGFPAQRFAELVEALGSRSGSEG